MFFASSEDGGEKRTVFNHNLGLGTRKSSLQPSDKETFTYDDHSFWTHPPLVTYIISQLISTIICFWASTPNHCKRHM